MKCPRCQVENDAAARFCEDCGARFEAACPSCGTPVTPGKKFCRSCGAALSAEEKGNQHEAWNRCGCQPCLEDY